MAPARLVNGAGDGVGRWEEEKTEFRVKRESSGYKMRPKMLLSEMFGNQGQPFNLAKSRQKTQTRKTKKRCS